MEKEKRKREGGRRGDLEGNKKSCTRRKGKEEDRRRVRLGKEKVEEGAQEGGLESVFFLRFIHHSLALQIYCHKNSNIECVTWANVSSRCLRRCISSYASLCHHLFVWTVFAVILVYYLYDIQLTLNDLYRSILSSL